MGDIFSDERMKKKVNIILNILCFGIIVAFLFTIGLIIYGTVMGIAFSFKRDNNRRELIHDVIDECNLSNNNYIRITVNIINDEITSDKSKQITGFTIEKERNSIVYYHE